MKLQSLFKDLDVKVHGPLLTEIKDLAIHSKFVKPGDLFVAVKGHDDDGSMYIEEAILSGCACVLCDFYNPFLKVTQVVTNDPKALLPTLAKRFYKDPSSKLFLTGITGTNGKTTTSYLLKHLLDDKQAPCGLMGTIEYVIKDHVMPASLTTPDTITINKYLRDMVKLSCKSCVMEVSSHALVQKRAEGLSFDIGVFTNLSEEHLDYHKDMEDYALAKAKLFALVSRASVLNIDDPYFQIMKEHSKAPVYTFGIEKSADLMAKDITCTPNGLRFTAIYKQEAIDIQVPFIGAFNVYNILAAMLVAMIHGMPLAKIAEKLKTAPKVKGRLEKIPVKKDVHVYVDFAHKEKALCEVLKTLRSFSKKRVITVFGCGGDRDTLKRPKMGAASEKHSDLVILTSDNPRGEDPLNIIEDIKKGMSKKSSCLVIPDRKEAIAKAIQVACKGDIVLIAGRGHERLQKLKGLSIDFSDAQVAMSV
ncbi:MAG: UDP-N-acetylmuramoyl-L-alanyl-D-glutamate--2,6-diaminopimelate ligase [Chlamydiia bacterium]|nr:UDP-N-acetylmuramoyl-L-alanyl-D-glutamate--2,6-diaminopimelate ligase [Chlamydiia bacterium]